MTGSRAFLQNLLVNPFSIVTDPQPEEIWVGESAVNPCCKTPANRSSATTASASFGFAFRTNRGIGSDVLGSDCMFRLCYFITATPVEIVWAS
jgi:hypothetical protein